MAQCMNCGGWDCYCSEEEQLQASRTIEQELKDAPSCPECGEQPSEGLCQECLAQAEHYAYFDVDGRPIE